jgi:hypothetical protein
MEQLHHQPVPLSKDGSSSAANYPPAGGHPELLFDDFTHVAAWDTLL